MVYGQPFPIYFGTCGRLFDLDVPDPGTARGIARGQPFKGAAHGVDPHLRDREYHPDTLYPSVHQADL